MIVTSIDKFYHLVMNWYLQIKHLYPSREKHSLPKYITKAEVKKLASIANLKHECIIKLRLVKSPKYLESSEILTTCPLFIKLVDEMSR